MTGMSDPVQRMWKLGASGVLSSPLLAGRIVYRTTLALAVILSLHIGPALAAPTCQRATHTLQPANSTCCCSDQPSAGHPCRVTCRGGTTSSQATLEATPTAHTVLLVAADSEHHRDQSLTGSQPIHKDHVHDSLTCPIARRYLLACMLRL